MGASMPPESQRASTVCAYLAVASAAIIGLWAVSMTGGLFGPDARYMVAAGRWILEYGPLPETDPLTIHAQLPYICQQWPVCVLLALVHDLLGEAALRALFALIDIAGALALFSVARRVGLRGAVSTTLACAAVFWMSGMEASTPGRSMPSASPCAGALPRAISKHAISVSLPPSPQSASLSRTSTGPYGHAPSCCRSRCSSM